MKRNISIRLFSMILAAFVYLTIGLGNVQNADAQIHRPIRSFNQSFGIWRGDGRHIRTPGHDTSYYNAYNAFNSALVSRGDFSGYRPYRANQFTQQMYNQHQNSTNQMQFYPPIQTSDPRSSIQAPPRPSSAPLQGGSYEKFDLDDEEDVEQILPADKNADEFLEEIDEIKKLKEVDPKDGSFRSPQLENQNSHLEFGSTDQSEDIRNWTDIN